MRLSVITYLCHRKAPVHSHSISMECHWDVGLLRCGDSLPPELLQVIQYGSNEQYLEVITRASLDARYTLILFAHCEPLFAHVCASLRVQGSLAAAVATLGRILRFGPYIAPYAIRLLQNEQFDYLESNDEDEILLYHLGLFRLLHFDHRTFKQFVKLADMYALLTSTNRPVVYSAIRILQICLDGADCWFEQMVAKYLGEDTPDNHIDGRWDEKIIDYRFLSLWEEDRYDRIAKLLAARNLDPSPNAKMRNIQSALFHPSTALIGNMLLPRNDRAMLEDRVPPLHLLATATVASNLASVSNALKSDQPLLLTGLAGSGKTLLVRHVAHQLNKLDGMITLHLNEQSDAKLLVGIYTTSDTPGSFVWRPGVLTTAVQEGRWVLIEDLDRAPNEIMGMLLPLVESRELLIPNRKQTVYANPEFRIIATIRSQVTHRGEETRPATYMLGARHWNTVQLAMPPVQEQQQIASALFPSLADLLPQFAAVYERLQSSSQRASLIGHSKTGVARSISPRDLLKWCSRVERLLRQKSSFTDSDMDDIFLEAIDCFVGALPDGIARHNMAAAIAEKLFIDPQRRDYLLSDRDVKYNVDKTVISVGRYRLPRLPSKKAGYAQNTFSTNPHTSRMLERVAAAVVNHEPLLLVGETGVGKTTAVQHLAMHLGKKLEVFNLSQQSEAGDMLGGFKPVTARSLIVPMKDEFDELFQSSFSVTKNQYFLELLGKQMAKSNWKAVCKLWQQALQMVAQQRTGSPARHGEAPSKKRKVDSKTLDLVLWDAFSAKVSVMERRLAAGNESFAFSFVEGNIVKAVRNGGWVLLDEINLASPDTLESIADLLDPTSPSLLLTEAGSVERIDAHSDFRIFAAMNPATDVGKKDLPPGIRSRFTELYVESPDKDIKSLQAIVKSYLRSEATSDLAIALDVSTLHQKVIGLAEQNRLVDGAGQKPHFSLRTLTRTLSYAKYIAPQCSIRRALYEGFQMSFLTFLDAESAALIQPLLEQHLFGKRINIRAELQKALRKPNDGSRYVQVYPGSKHWVHQGDMSIETQEHYILTPFIQKNLENLVRASSTRQFPVLVQGPTSSGKTSMIEYLAKRTGYHFVRINNHEHTDLQEYLGTYVSGPDGRLQFQEGILVQALRRGHWIVLDELNLAPTDVLEALNRLLDDNRELLIPETQEVVRPHANFMLFATQNPAGLYGGRKVLSRAFRNRFLELHFDDIPVDELQEILHRRTQLPQSRCQRIVTVYRELSVLRQENRLFEQKSFATLRDLFRWALRPNDTIEQVAANGFMLLAERVRKIEERQILKNIMERVMSAKGPRVTIDESALYAENAPEIYRHDQNTTQHGIVWTKAMRRLYVLVSRAIANNEPVLLVGETGCGKTTVCQMLADAFSRQLHTVNAHQNTETGDLIGSQRPIRDRAVIEGRLRHQLLSSAALQNVDATTERSTDVLLEVYDHEIASLGKDERQQYAVSTDHENIQIERTRYKALFEWQDGSLVQAMKEGAFFLLDEISLADDSVLERMNSVLESQRSILLAEKGSSDSLVHAAAGFQLFATMNPGGDYGKRELSPALRNRFTEIWVPPLSEAEDVVLIVHTKLAARAKDYATAIVAFATWFQDKYNTSASSCVSIRDALAWVEFINAFQESDVVAAVVHGAAMVYIDTLGANPAGLMSTAGRGLLDERKYCLVELSRLIGTNASEPYASPLHVIQDEHTFGIGLFQLARRGESSSVIQEFTFGAPTPRQNAMRVLRATTLRKPIMLEGSPGVGKTALVSAIAGEISMPLTRINLSEQTDLLDLFGSDVPVAGATTGTFAWCDAPFLRAMKTGEWVLLDEMNLASQSVLEGLNACLDHRGEVFVPELGRTFTRHPEFRLFAAQNPHDQGGGRKGLPASFVNRFTVVYADVLRAEDLQLICAQGFPQLDGNVIARAVNFVSRLDATVNKERRLGFNGGPWEFNLRDTSRWLALVSSADGLLRAATTSDITNFLFSQRFRSTADRSAVADLFATCFEDTPPACDMFSSLSLHSFQLGFALLPRNPLTSTPGNARAPITLSTIQLKAMQSVMLCVQKKWPLILAGPAGSGKKLLLKRVAALAGASVVTIAMNADTDTIDLIGGYEQSDINRQSRDAVETLHVQLARIAKRRLLQHPSPESAEILESLGQDPSRLLSDLKRAKDYLQFLPVEESGAISQQIRLLEQSVTIADEARFDWMDGILVEALQVGKWLVLDNANLCSASVLDRLNSLLEPDGALIVNEYTDIGGAPRVIHPHPDFRIFLTVDPRYGELSRAMRNRAVEVFLPPQHDTSSIRLPAPESTMACFHQMRSVTGTEMGRVASEGALDIVSDHMAIHDQSLVSRLNAQFHRGLYSDGRQGLQLKSMQQAWETDCLEDFYVSTASDLQVSADLARVQVSDSATPVSIALADGKAFCQTLHPLNNQAFLHNSEERYQQASTLAFIFDSVRQATALIAAFEQVHSKHTAVKMLAKVERSLSLGRGPTPRPPSLLAVAKDLLLATVGVLKSGSSEISAGLAEVCL